VLDEHTITKPRATEWQRIGTLPKSLRERNN
jgi:hypothetical protein